MGRVTGFISLHIKRVFDRVAEAFTVLYNDPVRAGFTLVSDTKVSFEGSKSMRNEIAVIWLKLFTETGKVSVSPGQPSALPREVTGAFCADTKLLASNKTASKRPIE